MHPRLAAAALVTALALGTTGCATIAGQESQFMPIDSRPDGATVVIHDEHGAKVFESTTPASASLPKSDGSYFGKKSYSVTISKPGFKDQTVQLTARANGLYAGGNIIFGGLIGWLIVDPYHGGMYTLTPKAVYGSLAAEAAALPPPPAGGVAVVLLEDVPPALRSALEPVVPASP